MKVLSLRTGKIVKDYDNPLVHWCWDEVGIYSVGDVLLLNGKEHVIIQNKQGKYNIVNRENGKKILPRFVDWIQYKEEKLSYFLIQYKDGTYNIVNSQGKLLSKRWLYYIPLSGQWWWNGGFFRVAIEEGKWNIMNGKGEFICKQDFVHIGEFVNHNNYKSKEFDIRKVFAIVTKNHKPRPANPRYSDPCDFDNVVNLEGTLILKDWYSIASIDSINFLAWKEHGMHRISIETGRAIF